MDRIKIGKFIAKCRKDKCITQEQLAEMLNITNKSVSKWENGTCLPDPSLYEPLCDILEITINELFAGQRMKDSSLLQMLQYQLYCLSDKSISFHEFSNALNRIAEVTAILESFQTKEEAVDYFMQQTNASLEECSQAYDFYMHLFKEKEFAEDIE